MASLTQDRVGRQTGARCPKCSALLIVSAVAEWCSNIECHYHLRNGLVVSYLRMENENADDMRNKRQVRKGSRVPFGEAS